MDHYIDISVLPDPEFPATILLNAVYDKFHKVLYDLAATNIGVSFPKYQATLGNILRIHGKKEVLQHLSSFNWMSSMSSFCEVSPVQRIPTSSKFRIISRKQHTMSQSKLRRLVRRGSIKEDEMSQYKTKMLCKNLANPYVELVSHSNGQKHRRYIEFGKLLDKPIVGEFDQFGLSKTATIPWFD